MNLSTHHHPLGHATPDTDTGRLREELEHAMKRTWIMSGILAASCGTTVLYTLLRGI